MFVSPCTLMWVPDNSNCQGPMRVSKTERKWIPQVNAVNCSSKDLYSSIFFLRLIKHFFAPFMLTYNHSKKRDLLVQLYKYNLYLSIKRGNIYQKYLLRYVHSDFKPKQAGNSYGGCGIADV